MKRLSAYFPGNRKRAVKMSFDKKTMEILYEDGSSRALRDPIQVQDVKLLPGQGPAFMRALREIDPYASKVCFYERELLEKIKSQNETITEEQFFKAVGHMPENDDLERCNCDQVGKTGHWSCGWCKEHNKPVFVCGCIMIKED